MRCVAQAVAPTTFGLDAHGGHGFESGPMSFLLSTPHLFSLSYPVQLFTALLIKGKKSPKINLKKQKRITGQIQRKSNKEVRQPCLDQTSLTPCQDELSRTITKLPRPFISALLCSSRVRLARLNMKPDEACERAGLSHKRAKTQLSGRKNLGRHDAIFVVARHFLFI